MVLNIGGVNNCMKKSYSEMLCFFTYEERLEYLRTKSKIGYETFGSYRYLNQDFYKSKMWKKIRNKVILRDYGRDLAVPGLEIDRDIIIHHINPITPEDILNKDPNVYDLDNLVCVSRNTHRLIHYGGDIVPMVSRAKGDTKLW